MPSVKKIAQLIDAEVDARTAAVIERLRPSIEAEIRAELADAVLGGAHQHVVPVDGKPLTPQKTREVLSVSLDPIVAARGITQIPTGWMCIYCGEPFKTQRAASIHARGCSQKAAVISGEAPPVTEPRPRQRDVVNKKEARARTCIKPGCDNKSKGPRFHHLCADHRKAPKRQWQVWQKKAREDREAA